MKNLYTLMFSAFVLFPFLKMKGQDDKKIVAKIESKNTEGQMKLSAVVTNNSDTYQELNYLLISIKKGNGGNISNNKQSGKFSINPSETKKLSEISVNLNSKDALKTFLYIRDEQTKTLISKDSLVVNSNDFQQTARKVEEEKYSELKGLTIDETKSKIGKDFYDAFYMQYNQLTEKSNYTITISELPSRGTTGQIIVTIDDKQIYSFFTNPNEDYLKEQLAMTFRNIKDYNAKKNLIRNEFLY